MPAEWAQGKEDCIGSKQIASCGEFPHGGECLGEEEPDGSDKEDLRF